MAVAANCLVAGMSFGVGGPASLGPRVDTWTLTSHMHNNDNTKVCLAITS